MERVQLVTKIYVEIDQDLIRGRGDVASLLQERGDGFLRGGELGHGVQHELAELIGIIIRLLRAHDQFDELLGSALGRELVLDKPQKYVRM